MRSGSGRVHQVEVDTREEEDQGWWAAGPHPDQCYVDP